MIKLIRRTYDRWVYNYYLRDAVKQADTISESRNGLKIAVLVMDSNFLNIYSGSLIAIPVNKKFMCISRRAYNLIKNKHISKSWIKLLDEAVYVTKK